MLAGEHVGSTGTLYLLLRMYHNTARLAVNVPNDRGLHNAPWLRAVLVSFAVVDLTDYAMSKSNANVRVVPSMSVHGQAISDGADSFIPEFFWSQPVTGSDWQHEGSLFSVYANGFAGSMPCALGAETQPLAQIDLAPWDASNPMHTSACWAICTVALASEFTKVKNVC
jgi:hypothetical protein